MAAPEFYKLVSGRFPGSLGSIPGGRTKEEITMLGEFIRSKRMEKKQSLIKFCISNNLDASKWSKLERERLGLNIKPELLNCFVDKLSAILEISLEEKQEITKMVKEHPDPEPVSEKELINHLPLFVTTNSRSHPTHKQLLALAELIKESLEPESISSMEFFKNDTPPTSIH